MQNIKKRPSTAPYICPAFINRKSQDMASTAAFVIFIMCLAGLLTACTSNTQNTKVQSIVIDVTGDNFNWKFRYPGKDGILGNGDDQYSTQDLYLPDNAKVKLKLASKDYLYTFALPDYELNQIAVPGLSFELDFTTQSAKTTRLLGDQFCGFSHETLKGDVHIIDQTGGYYGWKTDAKYH